MPRVLAASHGLLAHWSVWLPFGVARELICSSRSYLPRLHLVIDLVQGPLTSLAVRRVDRG